MKSWWFHLSDRERYLVGTSGFVILIVLIYVFAWLPLSNAATRAHQKVAEKMRLLKWMQRADNHIEMARARGFKITSSKVPVLLASVESGLAQCHLSKYIQSVQQSQNNEVTFSLHHVPFDPFIDCVHGISRREGITPKYLKVSAIKTPGIADIKITMIQ